MENVEQKKIPEVSVIMLTYNHARYIHQAVDSVLCQETAFSIEILIGDDASTDGTSEIVQTYAQRYPDRIVAVVRRANMGATENLYDLQQRARGKYIAYLECDDFWTDNRKLQRQVEFLEANEEFIGCTHKLVCANRKGTPVDRSFFWISEKTRYTIRDFDGVVLPGHMSSLVHRNIFLESEGKYRKLIVLHPMIADRTLCLLLASMGDLYQLPQTMSCYRIPEAMEESATVKAYTNNQREIMEDYVFTCQIRSCAKKDYGIYVDFYPHVVETLSRAIQECLRKPSAFSVLDVVRILWTERDYRLMKHLLSKIAKRKKE